MSNARVVPLLHLDFGGKYFTYSVIDVTPDISGIELFDQLLQGMAFLPRLNNFPELENTLDPYAPSVITNSVKLEIHNVDRLQLYGRTAKATLVYYDLNSSGAIGGITGRLFDIGYDKHIYSCTLRDEGDSTLVDQPTRVLTPNLFQTIQTVGPFTRNILDNIGLMVEIYTTDNSAVTAGPGWPATPGTIFERCRSAVKWIEHESLYNEDDDYWVGALVSIVQDPLNYDQDEAPYSVRTSSVAGHPYFGWPDDLTVGVPDPANSYKTLKSHFALGQSAFVVRGATGDNASFDAVNKRGRIWLDTTGPVVTAGSATRLENADAAGVNERHKWSNISQGAKSMGSLDSRHILRIYRNNIPENVDSTGRAFPIAYGNIKKSKVIHAIGGKSLADSANAGNDTYIICNHPIAEPIYGRFDNSTIVGDRLDDILQFKNIKVWHSLDEHPNWNEPWTENENAFGPLSLNPLPRVGSTWMTWGESAGGTSPADVAFYQKEPYLKWFIAGEAWKYRYSRVVGLEDQNRQITIVDNDGDNQYTGFRLRGDEYWRDIGTEYIAAGVADTATENVAHPQYPIRYGLGSANLYVDFNGHPDFDDGYITGLAATSISPAPNRGEIKSPAAMVSNPADIILHYLLQYTKLNGDRSQIDLESFRNTRGLLRDWKFATLFDDVNQGADNLERLLRQCRCILTFDAGKYSLRHIVLDKLAPVKYVLQDGVLNDSLKFNIVDNAKMYSTIIVKYDFYIPQETWQHSISYRPENHLQLRKASDAYGINETLTFEAPDIMEFGTARALIDLLVELYSKPRLAVDASFNITDKNSHIRAGDTVGLLSADLPPDRIQFNTISKPISPFAQLPVTVPEFKRFIITSITHDTGVATLKLLEI